MEMYRIEKMEKQHGVQSSGVPIGLYTSALFALEKAYPNMGLEGLSGYCFIFVDKGALEIKSDHLWSGELLNEFTNKKSHLYVVKESGIHAFVDKKGEPMFAALCQGDLWVDASLSLLEEQLKKSTVEPKSEAEADALKWLESGRVGLSSGALCALLYPNLRSHHKLKSVVDDSGSVVVHYPRDSADFERCVLFLKVAPEGKERLEEARQMGDTWDRLVSEWSVLEDLLQSDRAACSQRVSECQKNNGPKAF